MLVDVTPSSNYARLAWQSELDAGDEDYGGGCQRSDHLGSQELRDPKLGGFLVVQQIAYTMLVQALRLHLTEGLSGGIGWLFARADKQIGRAIGVLHEYPAHDWTLQELAGRIGMSRTTFAQKFKKTVGVPAMDTLQDGACCLPGTACCIRRTPSPSSRDRSGMNLKAPSARRLGERWDAHRAI